MRAWVCTQYEAGATRVLRDEAATAGEAVSVDAGGWMTSNIERSAKGGEMVPSPNEADAAELLDKLCRESEVRGFAMGVRNGDTMLLPEEAGLRRARRSAWPASLRRGGRGRTDVDRG